MLRLTDGREYLGRSGVHTSISDLHNRIGPDKSIYNAIVDHLDCLPRAPGHLDHEGEGKVKFVL